MSKVIGITGGIGCGKSAVTHYLEKHHYPVIDSDVIAREVVAPQSEGLNQIIECFGEAYLNDNGTLNRTKLRQLIFNDDKQKQQLEKILHPLIQQRTLQKINKHKTAEHPLIFVAIPLLIEVTLKKGKPDYIDDIWVVECSQKNQIARASQRDNVTVEDIKRIIQKQATSEERSRFADVTIDNNQDLHHLCQQLDKLLPHSN